MEKCINAIIVVFDNGDKITLCEDSVKNFDELITWKEDYINNEKDMENLNILYKNGDVTTLKQNLIRSIKETKLYDPSPIL